MADDLQYSVVMPDGSRTFFDCFGVRDYAIDVRGKRIKFSFSDRFGPMPLNKKGGELMLGPRHPFWRIVSLWKLQGRRIDDQGIAVWHEPKQPITEKRGRHYFLIENGEPGWDW